MKQILFAIVAVLLAQAAQAQNAPSLPVLATCGTATYAAGNLGYQTLLPGGATCVAGSLTLAGTTSNASSGVATSATNLPTVAYTYGFNGTTWDQLQVDGSKNLKTTSVVTGPLGATVAAVTSPVSVVEPDDFLVTGSVSSAAVLFTQDMQGYASLSLQVTANASANTVSFETSDDNTSWFLSPGLAVTATGNGSPQTTTTTLQDLIFPKRGKYFRARVSTQVGGTTTVVGYLHKQSAQTVIAAVGLVNSAAIIGKVGIDQTTDITTNGVEIAPTAGAAAGLTPVVSASAESSHVLKASAGNLYGVSATNLTATGGFLVVLNSTTAPADGAITPLVCVPLPASSVASISYNPGPAAVYSTGITAVVTSAATCFTKTTGVITAFIAGAVK